MFSIDTEIVPLHFGKDDIKVVVIKDNPESIIWASITDGDRSLAIRCVDSMAGQRSDVLHISMRKGVAELMIGPAASMDITRIHITDQENARIITVIPYVEDK